MPRRFGAHAMVGRGGVVRVPHSESADLTTALNSLMDALNADTRNDAETHTREAIRVLQQLRTQVSEGYHRNPSSSRVYEPFKIVGTLGRQVESVKYIHEDDGKPYQHDFKGTSAEVLAVERHGKRELLIASPRGVPLWDEF